MVRSHTTVVSPLVGDAHGRYLISLNAGQCHCFTADGQESVEQFLRVVADPARFRVVLGNLPVGGCHHTSVMVKDKSGRPGSALVDRQYVTRAI